MGTYQTYLVSDWAFCCRKVSLCILMAWRLFLSRSLAAAGIFWIKKLSGNQIMLAVRVMAGAWNSKRTGGQIIKCRLNNKLFNSSTIHNGRQFISRKIKHKEILINMRQIILLWHRVKAFLYLVWSITVILFCLNIKQHTHACAHIHLHTFMDFKMSENMQKIKIEILMTFTFTLY